MDIRDLLADIHALEEELLDFERKFGIRSETFYAAYASGEEPDDNSWMLDFGEWARVYRTWLTRQAEYRNEIQKIQRQSPGLAGWVWKIKPSPVQYKRLYSGDQPCVNRPSIYTLSKIRKF